MGSGQGMSIGWTNGDLVVCSSSNQLFHTTHPVLTTSRWYTPCQVDIVFSAVAVCGGHNAIIPLITIHSFIHSLIHTPFTHALIPSFWHPLITPFTHSHSSTFAMLFNKWRSSRERVAFWVPHQSIPVKFLHSNSNAGASLKAETKFTYNTWTCFPNAMMAALNVLAKAPSSPPSPPKRFAEIQIKSWFSRTMTYERHYAEQ